MSTHPLHAALTGAVFVALIAGPAAAGTKDDVRNLQDRMTRVEQSAAAQGATSVRVSELERHIQTLTGRIEELSYQLDLANQRLDAVSAALAGGEGATGVQTGEPFGGEAPGGPVDLSTGDPIAGEIRRADDGALASGDEAAAAISVELPLDPAAAYDYASGYLLAGDYPRAKAAFKLYVDAFPNHPRTADAQFRLGEIHLAIGENADAADAFIKHIQTYPSDERAAEAYLKLGTAFSRMDNSDQACTVFKSMQQKFPDAAGPVRQRAELEMARIDCR